MATGVNWYKADLRELVLRALRAVPARRAPGQGALRRPGARTRPGRCWRPTYRFAREVLGPLNATGDREGCRLENGQVRTPKGFKEAWKQLYESGFKTLGVAAEHGGQGAPRGAVRCWWRSCSPAPTRRSTCTPGWPSARPRPSSSAARRSRRSATRERMLDGTWGGTMCLTEPHAGQRRGLGEDHRAASCPTAGTPSGARRSSSPAATTISPENIVHLVLARVEGAPPGTKGLSLFIVPKKRIAAEGTAGREQRRQRSAPSSTRWASTARRPRSSTSARTTAARASWSAPSRTWACPRCSG